MVKKVGMSFGGPANAAGPVTITVASLPAIQHEDRRGEMLTTAHRACQTRPQFASEVNRLWREAQHRFLEIGRYLCEAKERLDHGEFMPMIESDLPFSHKVAVKLMAVARAVDDGVFPRDSLPPSYATVYELVSLKPAERERAMQEGLVAPTTTREAVIRFKKRIRGGALAESHPERKTIERRLRALLVERDRLDQEIAALTRKLNDLPE